MTKAQFNQYLPAYVPLQQTDSDLDNFTNGQLNNDQLEMTSKNYKLFDALK